MSGALHRLDPHQYQHAHQHQPPPSSQDFPPALPGSGAGSLYADAAVMDVHHQPFNDFAFAMSGIPDPTSVDFPVPTAPEIFAQLPAVAPARRLSHADAGTGVGPGTGTPVAAPDRKSSMDGLDGAVGDGGSPLAGSLEDAGDEFDMFGHGPADGTDLGAGRSKDDKSGGVPAWSELKTKAGKERKRLPLACIACRRKKIRCSGEKPACKHCLRSRIPCVYKVTTRKAAPRTDYMAMLDKRLKRMEERIIKVIPQAEQEAVSNVTRAVVKPAIPGALHGGRAAAAAARKRGAVEAFGADLEAWAKARPRSKSQDDGKLASPGAQGQEAEEDRLLQEGTDALPAKDVQEHLAEVFFDNVYGQAYQLLHKPSYMSKLKHNALPPVLVLSVCAVAARFTSNPKFNSSTRQFLRGEEWAAQAREICTRRYEWPNITVLTCLLILGLHEFGTCQGGRSWALGGQAIRMAFALQLHKDLDHDPVARGSKRQLSFIDREIRRRIMWACFLMDRFNSSGSDRPMFIREETIKIPLPVKEHYFQLDMPMTTESLHGEVLDEQSPTHAQDVDPAEAMGVSAYLIRSISLWGRIVSYLNQGGKEADAYPMWSDESEFAGLLNEAETFTSSLPEVMTYSPENLNIHDTENSASQFLLLHISIRQNVLFMNRNAVTFSKGRPGENAPEEFLSQARAKTFAAANGISDLLKAAESSRNFVSAPFAGYCAFASTTIHILGIFSGNPTVKATAEANSSINIKFLRRMMKHWGMFHWMVENIRTQYRDALDAVRTGTLDDVSVKSSAILQYGDWFNRYPHGVSDADFMDPAMHKQKEKGADGVLEPKSELQSVEEFFTTLSPMQTTESREGQRGSAPKRKPAPKKGAGGTARAVHPPLQIPVTEAVGRPIPSPISVQAHQQQRRFSAPMGIQTSGPGGPFTPQSVPHSQNAPYHIMTPISPVNVSQFQVPPQAAFFSPDMLSMNLPSQANGMVQPMDQQLAFGNYSMEAGASMAGGPGMMDGMPGWDGMGRQAMKGAPLGGGNLPHSQGQIPRDAMDGAFTTQDASGAWLMPFNMEHPDGGVANMGMAGGNVDAFTGMFNGGSGMTTPNPMGSLQHGP